VNVTLRALEPADADWLDDWLPPVAASVGYDAIDPAQATASLRRHGDAQARIISRNGERAGLVVYRMRPGDAAAMIELVAVPPQAARQGSGMSAAAAVEAELCASGTHRIYAPAPEVHGIATYFWIRLGYRPLPRAAWPCERAGVAWLLREI
jgi:hypothetical protein